MIAAKDVFDLQWKDETGVGHCLRSSSHTCVALAAFNCSDSSPLLPSPTPTLGASYLCQPMPPPPHTPLPVQLRGGTAVNEQARPLRSADRALIWRPMPGKRLIKVRRWEGGRALSCWVKASQLSGLIGRGASGQLLGRDWVTWWLSGFHTVAGCTFTFALV